jgi:hypothetical protein
LQTALIGSWWSGLQRSSPIHIRSVFDDIPETGSEMQFSAMMLNLWERHALSNSFQKSGLSVLIILRKKRRTSLSCGGSCGCFVSSVIHICQA